MTAFDTSGDTIVIAAARLVGAGWPVAAASLLAMLLNSWVWPFFWACASCSMVSR